ncbi:hypothetical protein F4780DRAFT_204103 [Xylariomycetidae sp. FL0641]|nr:hypothetical protein F4780DRAFT_204103 [Xylariomycetidae sp. FL0641]
MQQPEQPEHATQDGNGDLIDRSIRRLEREKDSKPHFLDLWRLQHIESILREGDTLVIVKFPSQSRDCTDCSGYPWKTKEIRIWSEKLLATGSSVFASMLTPVRQARIRRHLKRPPSDLDCQYILDLTPSDEGEDSAALLMELSLPQSIRDWPSSEAKLGVSNAFVGGHDDRCHDHDGRGRTRDLQLEDYCPIRHRASILRLLLHINGEDVVLDSASRVYTLVGVAKSLDCTHAIRDAVLVWFLAENNTSFIDYNPEAALDIAWTLELEDVARAAFRLLVVENALEILAAPSTTAPRAREPLSVFGRRRGDLAEEPATSVQHAGQRVAQRIQRELAMLRSLYLLQHLHQTHRMPEWRGFERYAKSFGVDVYTGELDALPASVVFDSTDERRCMIERTRESFRVFAAKISGLVLYIISRAWEERETMDSLGETNRMSYGHDSHKSIADILKELTDAQCIMTPGFWKALGITIRDTSSYMAWANVAGDRSPTQQDNNPQSAWGLWAPNLISYKACVDELHRNLDMACRTPNVTHEDRQWFAAAYGGDVSRYRFDLRAFAEELNSAASRYCHEQITHKEPLLARTGHVVLHLTEDEFAFLPLWAGGLDDGTGALWQDAVPDAADGFSPIGPGPAFRTGATVPTDDTDSSSAAYASTAQSEASTVTATCGRSFAAVPSSAVPSDADAREDDAALDDALPALANAEDAIAWSLDEEMRDAVSGDVTTATLGLSETESLGLSDLELDDDDDDDDRTISDVASQHGWTADISSEVGHGNRNASTSDDEDLSAGSGAPGGGGDDINESGNGLCRVA